MKRMHIQVESFEELSEPNDRLIKAAMPVEGQKNTASIQALATLAASQPILSEVIETLCIW
jgi:hypothetical protein